MWIVPLDFLVVVAMLLLRGGLMSGWGRRRDRDETLDGARGILARRFAGRELTQDPYEDMKRTLER